MSYTAEAPLRERAHSPVKFIPNEDERGAVREQLAALLDSTPFKTSKRCAAFLGHIVEKCLRGESDDLKERTIGIDLFHRSATYDTNSDPVVRMAASETRRRLAQCYDGAMQQRRIRIQLPHGSYVPEFYRSIDAKADRNYEAAPVSPLNPPAEEPDSPFSILPVHQRFPRLKLATPVLCVLLGALLSLAANRILSAASSAPLSALDEFWRPLISAPGAAWLCVGEAYVSRIELDPNGARNRFASPYPLSSGEQRAYPALNLADSSVLAHVAGLLETRNKKYSVHGETETTFSDLAGGPSVLIGSFNNDWTIRLSDQLRFHFEMNRETGEQWIVDRQKPDEKVGVHSFNLATPDTKDAYAIISRVRDPSTGQMVVALAGVSANGTKAAGTFVSEPTYLDEFAKRAPRDWQNANLQIVIAAPIVDGALGPPHVVDSYVW